MDTDYLTAASYHEWLVENGGQDVVLKKLLGRNHVTVEEAANFAGIHERSLRRYMSGNVAHDGKPLHPIPYATLYVLLAEIAP